MPTEYLCLDDENTDRMQPLIDTLNSQSPDLNVTLERPREFADEIGSFRHRIPDGLILDLWLDEFPANPGEFIEYKAGSLAQELRTRMAERQFDSFPIVLWSINRKLEQSFEYDDAAKDLFDLVYLKSEVTSHPKRMASELVSLATGYQQISKVRHSPKGAWYVMLGLSEDSSLLIHPRLQEVLAGGRFPVHHYAQYILKEVVLAPGLLISEEVLAARLGVDRENSPDWSALLAQIAETCRYTGAFSDAWQRWWALLVERWWRDLPNNPGALRGTNAADRVKFLKQATKLRRLEAATPIDSGYSSNFWSTCLALRQPLDPVDGILADVPETKPWQEPRYLSLKSVLDRRAAHRGFKIHPLERERIKNIRKRMRDAQI